MTAATRAVFNKKAAADIRSAADCARRGGGGVCRPSYLNREFNSAGGKPAAPYFRPDAIKANFPFRFPYFPFPFLFRSTFFPVSAKKGNFRSLFSTVPRIPVGRVIVAQIPRTFKVEFLSVHVISRRGDLMMNHRMTVRA